MPLLRCAGPTARVLGLAALVTTLALPALAGEPSRKPMALAEVAPALEAKDLDGATWRLADARLVTSGRAEEAVLSAARGLGETEPKATDELGTLATLRKGDGLDPEKVAALARAVGRPLGLVAGEATTAGWKTLADVAAWAEAGAKAPLVLVCWSPGCPTSRMYEQRLVEIATGAGARLVLVASNATDSDEACRARVKEAKLPFRVLLDPDQAITDVLGGRKTPHAFVLDATGALRYAGGVDDDAASSRPPDRRASWLRDAVVALTEGRMPDVLMTSPKG